MLKERAPSATPQLNVRCRDMTGREYIRKEVRVVGLFPWFFLLLIAASPVCFLLPLSDGRRELLTGTVIFISAVASVIMMTLVASRVVCPSCGKRLTTALRSGCTRGLPDRISHCPHCEVSFDRELKEDSDRDREPHR